MGPQPQGNRLLGGDVQGVSWTGQINLPPLQRLPIGMFPWVCSYSYMYTCEEVRGGLDSLVLQGPTMQYTMHIHFIHMCICVLACLPACWICLLIPGHHVELLMPGLMDCCQLPGLCVHSSRIQHTCSQDKNHESMESKVLRFLFGWPHQVMRLPRYAIFLTQVRRKS